MDALGYGAHLIVDGFGSSAPLHDERWLLSTADELLKLLDTHDDHVLRVSYWFPEGVSVGLALPNSHLTLHSFAQRQAVSLEVFSPQMLSNEGIGAQFRERLQIGRLEGYLGSRTVALPQDHDRAVKHLLGERSYTDLRLDEALLTL